MSPAHRDECTHKKMTGVTVGLKALNVIAWADEGGPGKRDEGTSGL
jgi:hypothetical protein